jgi:hypothetical protein
MRTHDPRFDYCALLVRSPFPPYRYFVTSLGPRYKLEEYAREAERHEPIIVPSSMKESTLALLNG